MKFENPLLSISKGFFVFLTIKDNKRIVYNYGIILV